ncbi:MAG: D-arabinono-1,4-lactone oxidase [Microbacterium sp.]|uniref:D-arabinono-1,4-lactone oxidase n=1 Tax=Microbacterium sp. TaxID=51671 RepID=UPI0039E3FC73
MERNWAGTYAYTAPRIEAVRSVAEVRTAVAGARRAHALGTRHSFTDLPDTAGTLLDVSALAGVIGEVGERVWAWAGTRYGVLAPALEARGRALFNMGSLPHIGVAGSTATGTHGSGDRNGVLSTAVTALRVVDADGEVREVRRDDPDFPALVVGVGAFGVVVAVELETVPSYRVRQDLYRGVRWETALADLGALTGAGYSVSIFTRWEPEDLGWVWVKTRVAGDDQVVADTLQGGRLTLEGSPLGSGDNITGLGGVPGPWMHRLPHFRLDREPSFGAEIQTEYFVPRAQGAAALDAVLALGDAIRPVLVWSEIRTAAADDLWLSPAYERDVVVIHFTWLDRPDEVAALVPLIEAALEPFSARPHWGKVHGFDAARLAAVHPRLADARAVFERWDPAGKFVNEHLVRVGVRAAR